MYGPVVYGYGETAWSANVVVASLKTVCRLGSNLTPERSGTFADTVTGTLPVRWLLEMRTSFVLTVRTPTFALNVSWGTVVVSAWSFTMKRLETSEPRNSHCGSTVSVMPTALLVWALSAKGPGPQMTSVAKYEPGAVPAGTVAVTFTVAVPAAGMVTLERSRLNTDHGTRW